MNVDCSVRGAKHIDIQPDKVRKRFISLDRFFQNKSLISRRARIIGYQLLARQVTYAVPNWWNVGASETEELRSFEKNCLRACLKLYRSIIL